MTEVVITEYRILIWLRYGSLANGYKRYAGKFLWFNLGFLSLDLVNNEIRILAIILM